MPSEARLVTVVEGTPAVPGSDQSSRRARYGAYDAWRLSSSDPSPSTSSTTYDPASGSTNPAGGSSIGWPSAAATAGTTSPSERWW